MLFLLSIAYFPIFLGVILVAELVAISYCNYGWAWFFLIVTAALVAGIFYHTGTVPLTWEDAGLYFISYVAAGVVWSFIKWIHQIHRIKWKMQDVFAETNDINHHVSEFNKLDSSRKIEINIPTANTRNSADGKVLIGKWSDYFPKVRQNKTAIGNWITFWPFSLLATVLQDFILELVDNLVEFFKNVYDNIGKWILSSTFK